MDIRLTNWLSLLRDSVTIMSAYSRSQLIFHLIPSSQIYRSTYWPTSDCWMQNQFYMYASKY